MAREAFELAESIEASSDRTVFNRLNALVVIGRVRARRGEPRAWQSLDAALELAEQIGELQRVAPVRSARAEAAWLDNDHERAAAEATPAYKLAVEKGHVWFAAEPALWLWRSEQLFELPIALPPPFAAHVAGDPTTAAHLWEQVGCPYEQADALADTDDVDSVRRSLEIAQSLGARPLAARAVGRLRRLGARPASPRPASRLTRRATPLQQLSPREREVVELITEGCTNREIAERLVISERTAENHVRRVLNRLGLQSRTQVAAWAVRNGLGVGVGEAAEH